MVRCEGGGGWGFAVSQHTPFFFPGLIEDATVVYLPNWACVIFHGYMFGAAQPELIFAAMVITGLSPTRDASPHTVPLRSSSPPLPFPRSYFFPPSLSIHTGGWRSLHHLFQMVYLTELLALCYFCLSLRQTQSYKHARTHANIHAHAHTHT